MQLNIGELVTLTIVVICGTAALYMYYKARKERLSEREAIIESSVKEMVFDNRSAIDDGFVFCSIWRLSHIIYRGRELGYELTIFDCYKVIASIKRDFIPEVGINTWVIDSAIKSYMREKIPLGWMELDDPRMNELYNSMGAT
jgi:hypothetical protein